MKIWIIWIYEKRNKIYQPILWSIHKTQQGAEEEAAKHDDAVMLTYEVEN